MMFRSLLCAFAFFALCPRILFAQHAIDGGRLVTHLGDFAPRFADLGGAVLRIAAGQTATLPADATFDTVEVAGVLRNDPSVDTVLRVTNLQVLSSGRLELVVPCGRRLELLIRDTPIDTAVDPFRWGNGVMAFGKVTIKGCAVAKGFAVATADLPKGVQSLQIEGGVPTGWKVGDELIIPDTRQQLPFETNVTKNAAQREATVRIAAISGDTVSLSKTLDFEHLSVTDPDGGIVLKPRVANVSRNVVIRSENPQGTTGHFASVGHDATWDIRYTEFRDMGRTTSVRVDNTTIEPVTNRILHVGTQQVGRYTIHFHHAQGFRSAFVGNAIVCAHDKGKWGAAFHRVSDTLIEHNVVVDCDGAGIVLEDGDEVRNTLRFNFAAYSRGGPGVTQGVLGMSQTNVGAECVACEGAGFWFKSGGWNTVEGNEAWNNRMGMVVFQNPILGRYPAQPGGVADTPFPRPLPQFASFSGNVTASNLSTGLDLWQTRGADVTVPELVRNMTEIKNHVSAYNWNSQIFFGPIPVEAGGVTLRNSKLICRGTQTIGLIFPRPYTWLLSVENTEVRGCNYGFWGGGGQNLTRINGGVWQNEIDTFVGQDMLIMRSASFVNMTHKPYPSAWPRLVSPAPPPEANGVHAFSIGGFSPWLPNAATPTAGCHPPGRLESQMVVNWMGTGKNFCLPGTEGTPNRP